MNIKERKAHGRNNYQNQLSLKYKQKACLQGRTPLNNDKPAYT